VGGWLFFLALGFLFWLQIDVGLVCVVSGCELLSVDVVCVYVLNLGTTIVVTLLPAKMRNI
jgi:hypothetical protein